MAQYLWLAFLLILVFLLVQNKDGVQTTVNALSAANVKTIEALQGRFSR